MVRNWPQEDYVWGLGAKLPVAVAGGEGGVRAEPTATENFCIFYLKKTIFSAFNCIIYCNNVLCIMHYANTKCSDM